MSAKAFGASPLEELELVDDEPARKLPDGTALEVSVKVMSSGTEYDEPEVLETVEFALEASAA